MGQNMSTAIFLINKKVRAIIATYESYGEGANPPPSDLNLFKTMDPDIKVGDLIVVPTDSRHNMTVFLVHEVDVRIDFDNPKICRWIIGKVDAKGYKQMVADEAAFIAAVQDADRKKRAEELRQNMFDAMSDDEVKKLPIYDLNEKEVKQ